MNMEAIATYTPEIAGKPLRTACKRCHRRCNVIQGVSVCAFCIIPAAASFFPVGIHTGYMVFSQPPHIHTNHIAGNAAPPSNNGLFTVSSYTAIATAVVMHFVRKHLSTLDRLEHLRVLIGGLLLLIITALDLVFNFMQRERYREKGREKGR